MFFDMLKMLVGVCALVLIVGAFFVFTLIQQDSDMLVLGLIFLGAGICGMLIFHFMDQAHRYA